MQQPSSAQPPVRCIAFYLPQYHPVPENDEWWGRGFTEWRNVAKARPLFRGHYQPHLPGALGFYDLRLAEAREAQASLAREHGIHGFCYYHYWFNGKRLLERPFAEVLASGKPDLPFCLCWANENWTRVWDGGAHHLLMQQHYSPRDDISHIHSLLPAFRDPRYIRIDGRPLFLVYRAQHLPDPVGTTKRWRAEARRAGLTDLYLACVESYESARVAADPRAMGFDAEVEFPPFSWPMGCAIGRTPLDRALQSLRMQSRAFTEHLVIPYQAMAQGMMGRPTPQWTRFRGVTPSWDNSARKKSQARIFPGSTPASYGHWLTEVLRRTMHERRGEERVVFINAWNEWAEGNHLEPDAKWQSAYLEATRDALACADALAAQPPASAVPQPRASKWKRLYWSAVGGAKAHAMRSLEIRRIK